MLTAKEAYMKSKDYDALFERIKESIEKTIEEACLRMETKIDYIFPQCGYINSDFCVELSNYLCNYGYCLHFVSSVDGVKYVEIRWDLD